MWPFRRKAESSPAGSGPQPVPGPVIRREWVGLPPIQRIIGEHPLTAPSERFSDDLATHHDPSISADTMGHQVSAEAPAGIILTLARPSTRSDGPAMIPRPRVQRRVDGAVVESGEWDGDEAASDGARPSPLPASVPAVAAHELPVVAPETVAQRLVSLPPDTAPIPVAPALRRSRPNSTPLTLSPSINDPSEPPPAQRLTLGQSRRLGLGAPIKRVPESSVQRTADESMDSPGPSAAPPAGPDPVALPPAPVPQPETSIAIARTLDQAMAVPAPEPALRMTPPSPANLRDEPRLDLPLAHRPAANDPSAQRAFSADDTAAIAPALPIEATAKASRESLNDASAASRDASKDLSSAPPAVVQRLANLPPRLSNQSSQTPTGDGPPTASVAEGLPSLSQALAPSLPTRLAAPPAASAPMPAAIAPLVGARPLRPSVTVQRSSDAPPHARENPAVQAPPPESGGVASHRDAESVSTADWFDAARSTDTETPVLPLVPVPAQRTPADLVPADEAGPFAQAYRPAGAVLPDRWTQASYPDARPQGGKETRSSRSPGLPLAPQPGIGVQRAAQALADSRTEPADAPAEPYGPTLQGSWYDSIAAGAGSLASSAMSSGGTAASGAVGSAVGAAASSLGHQQAAETDMDELAGKLYDRIRTRLKTELLIDRERAGFLTDLR